MYTYSCPCWRTRRRQSGDESSRAVMRRLLSAAESGRVSVRRSDTAHDQTPAAPTTSCLLQTRAVYTYTNQPTNQSINQSITHTHTHPFNGPLSGTTRVSRYHQRGKTNPDFAEARDSEWQRHQLGRMQVSISLQTDNHASTPPLRFFPGRMPFLPPNQQRQCTEG